MKVIIFVELNHKSDRKMIFNIQRYSTHDGDGVRTLIFFKGCPLRCQWCSNPESQSFQPSLLFDSKLCKGFEDCVQLAPEAISRSESNGLEIQRELIQDTGLFRDICATRALSVSGEELSVEQVMLEVEKDLPFYRKDGGVTLSGGEPLAQGEELLLLLHRLREAGIGVNMETSLHLKWALVERTIGLIRTYLVDLKHTDAQKFKHFTQGDARLVMENLEKLAYFGTHVIVRIPVIPGFNHSEVEIRGLVDFIATIKGIREVHFLPYHTFGVEKYRMLGMDYKLKDMKQVREEELLPYVSYVKSKGYASKIGG
jgi:pyruvate formate lyase activating enzyme